MSVKPHDTCFCFGLSDSLNISLKFCMSKVTKVGLDAKDEHKLKVYSTLKLVMEGNTYYKISQNNLRHKFVSQLMFILLWCTVMTQFKFTAVNDI